MIIYKGVSTDSLPGVTANLIDWSTLGGLSVETIASPGVDGRVVVGSSQDETEFDIYVLVRGSSPEEALERASHFAAFVDPARGTGLLNPTGLDGAASYPNAVVTDMSVWKRHTWDAGNGYQLRATVTFAADPHGRPPVDPSFTRSGAGTLAFTVEAGDTRCYPTVEVRGTLAAEQTVRFVLGDYACTITGPLTSAQVLRLDFENFEFAVWAGTTKAASVVTRMSSLDRLELWPDTAYSLAVTTTGSVDSVTVIPNSRTL